MTTKAQAATSPSVAQPGLARSATLLSIGNLGSRILGLVREVVISAYFGASGQVSAFRVASQIVSSLYDFLIGGMLSAALVPILSDYAQRRRAEFVQVIGILVSLSAVVLALLVLLVELTAPTLSWLLAAGFLNSNPDLLPLTVTLIRLVAPAIWLFSLAGVLMAVLYAQQRFTYPAIATAVYNLGLVVAAPLLASRLGIISLAIGVLIGSFSQLLLMGWDLRRAGIPLQWQWQWHHPALRKIFRLYLPNAGVLLLSLLQVGLDRRLASSTGEQGIAWMANATTLQQMPLGLISIAIALASLPRLSQYYAAGDEHSYQQTLTSGLRLVLLLIAPAAIGLWLLGTPLIRLLFEHGKFAAADTVAVTKALNIYVLGMIFAAIDFPLNYAFYARNNTWLPALVGVLSIVIYMIVAFALVGRLGYLGLVWADTAKQLSHALVMSLFLVKKIGRLAPSFHKNMAQLAVSAVIMALLLEFVSTTLQSYLPMKALGQLLLVAGAGGLGLLGYGLALHWLGVSEVQQVRTWLSNRFFMAG